MVLNYKETEDSSNLTPMIEISSNFKDKLDIAELVLKTLGIRYKIINTHTSSLYWNYKRREAK